MAIAQSKVDKCPRGHPYSGENLYINPRGDRECRICRQISKRKSVFKNKDRLKLITKSRNKFRKAFIKGNVLAKPCEKCGDIKSYAHHENYGKPLEVIWLCKKHHLERHKQIKNNKRNKYKTVTGRFLKERFHDGR